MEGRKEGRWRGNFLSGALGFCLNMGKTRNRTSLAAREGNAVGPPCCSLNTAEPTRALAA